MRIEQFFYTKEREQQYRRKQESIVQDIMRQSDHEQAVDAVLSVLFPHQYIIYTVADQTKQIRFWYIANAAMELAEQIGANLLIETEGLTGCIILAGEELGGKRTQKLIFNLLGTSSDEIHIRTTVNHGTGSPIDLDGLVQMEFWFDLYESVEIAE